MVLSRRDILRRLNDGSVRFDPQVPSEAIKQVSVDLRLGRTFTVFRERQHVAAIRISKELFTENEDLWLSKEEDFYILEPRKFVLAQTMEKVTLPNDLMGLVEGRSSWARLGISIHVTAPKIDPGYSNYITLEMANHGETAIQLVAGQSPCQLILLKLTKALKAAELYGAMPSDIFQRARRSSRKKR
jgi:dCTP deaminase